MNKDIKQAKILVVDDQEANVDVICDFLALQAYIHVMGITDSRKVENLISEYKPDIVLLDLSMPYLDGFEIMDMLKKIVPPNDYLPVLVLTADISTETRHKALINGASDFLSKPFDLLELQARVNTHLQIRYKNEQINQYNIELRKLVDIKDKFFSIIAHDLRNPFFGIENYTNILLKTGQFHPDTIKKHLNIIKSTATQGRDLLENLLRWMRSQTDTIVINCDAMVLRDSCEACIEMVRAQADNKGISLNNNIPGEIVINSDKDMIETILRNLITNAVKYTSSNGFVCVDSEVKGNDILISVKDTGVGMDPETTSGLFSINKSVQTTSGTSGEKGSGLGLLLCKEFAEKLGGQLKVESQINKGSVFTISLPNSVIYAAIG